MYRNPLQAYQTVEQNTISGRETEARVLTKAAMMLKACQDNWDTPDHRQKLDKALRYNQRIWSIIQAELLDDSNSLPKALKQNILSLSVFIDKRIFNIMAFPKPEKIKIVVDVNLNLAAGLRNSPQ